jgi:hypothetical protein
MTLEGSLFAPAALNVGTPGRSSFVTRHERSSRRQKRAQRIGLTLHPAEAEAIQELACSVGMSVASYLRAVGAGYHPSIRAC